MKSSDFDIRFKKEAKTALQIFKDQSLLRKMFGEEAVKLYNMIDSGLSAQQLMEQLGLSEENFVKILEFMNNNGMISVVEESQEEEMPKMQEPVLQPTELYAQKKEPPISPENLSPIEKLIYDKYGEVGIKVYTLIDGEKTAEEILRQTNISEAKLVEILEFLDEKGIIHLENPKKDQQAESSRVDSQSDKEYEYEPKFKPIIEESPEEKPFEPSPPPKPPQIPKKEEKKVEVAEDIIMVDVPKMEKLSLMQKATLFAELSMKFPKEARKLISLVDGKKDFVELALETGLSFFDIDSIFAYFGKKGFFTFSVLSRDEIKKRYGEDGFAIYKRYGRDGLLLYEMIGKEASLKDIITKSKIDVDRAVDIFLFIHKVLGIDIPLDRDIIYKQLGLKK
ncbi:MAG: hypothetical protein N3G80_00380 [Candidatus Micrarchaeota archaeon]|nr:hypothetical protein [Candidatus Micrarchaeota archaeon]